MKKLPLILAVFLAVTFRTVTSFAYSIPRDFTNSEYFYVFGAFGRTVDGADRQDPAQVIFFDVPKSQDQGLTIDIFDPDTGGRLDQKPMKSKTCDTIIEFTVFGKNNSVLASKRFGESAQYDMQYYRFGPFAKEKGEDTGDHYSFKLVARPVQTYLLKGEEVNVFNVRVMPEDVEAYAEKIFFRLSRNKGEEMHFYPLVPAGASAIEVENYDLDPTGGTASLYDPLTQERFKVNPSESGKWASTAIRLKPSDGPRRAAYIITKQSQTYGNAAVRVVDEDGTPLRLYFSEAVRTAAPVAEPARRQKQEPVAAAVKKTEPKPAVMKKTGPKPAAVPREAAKPAPAKQTEQKPATRMAVVPAEQGLAPCNRFTFDGTGSYDPNDEELSFFWDFGDGTTASEPVVTHVFEKAGTYTVTLTVRDTSELECSTATTSYTVKVNTPPVAVFSAPGAGCVGEPLVFDASASTDDSPESLTYVWDFGDGTRQEGVRATKQFDTGGLYSVRLTVNDNAGTACSAVTAHKKVAVNTPPVARAGDDITMCLKANKEYAVVFDASRSSDADGDALEYTWDFGDGESGAGKTVTHVYRHGGRYKAKLTVNDGRGSACSSGEDTLLVVLNRQPAADPGGDKVACVGTDVLFDGSASGDADNDQLAYSWDFGDGTTAQGPKARHAYDKPGNYKAALTVDDGRQTDCSRATAAVNVFVNKGPSAVLKEVDPVCANAKVQFDASATAGMDPAQYRYTWDFGDGTVSEGGAKATHQYKAPGRYIVSVTADDRKNTPCSTDRASIEVKVNTPPQAKAETRFGCCIDTDSVFDGSASFDADGDKLSYRWDFGDGAVAEGARAVHRYAKGGIYTVTLEVDDNSGTGCSTSRTSMKVNINDQPVAVIKVR